MAVAPKILGSDTLRQTYPKLNAAIDNSNEAITEAIDAKGKAESAVQTAASAEIKADSVQAQFNQVVIEGDSSVEAAQARVKADGTSFTTLQERLNSSDAQLAQTQTELTQKATKNELINHARNLQSLNKSFHPLKAVEKFDDALFNFDAVPGIGVTNGSVAGTKQLTTVGTTTRPNNTNVAVYNTISNVRGYEIEFEPGTVGSNVKIGFANDVNNFIFINLSTGELYLVINGVLDNSPLRTVGEVTISDGDRLKLIMHGNTIQLFKNGVLQLTYVPNPAVYYKFLANLNKNYPAVVFRDGTSTYRYGVNKLKVHQKSYPKFMHLSYDDEIIVLQQLTEQAPSSIFDIPTFAFLKEMHDKYGAVFTLNLFYQYTESSTFNLSNVTNAYANEFRNNSDWLKFAFHGYHSTVDYNTLDAATAKSHYDAVIAQIVRFASPQNIDTIPRTSNFRGNLANARAWRDTTYGVTGFLSADDDRTINLYLGTKEIATLKECDDMYDEIEKLYFMRTDLRLDTATTPYDTLTTRKTDVAYRGQQDAQIIFWHATANWTDTTKSRIEECCKWALDNGYVFLYPMDVNPKF